MKTYKQTKYGKYAEGDVAVTLRSSFGDYGGGSEVLVVNTLVFDSAQITSKLNYSHPTWGGNATLSRAQPDKQ
jgi:hypothetical protein